jgi:cell shape-determining protein MreD
MYLKIILNFILIVISSLVQFSFISVLPFGLDNFNFALVALVVILLVSSFSTSLWWAIGMGFLLDIYSFLPFGVYLACFFLTVLTANFLLVNSFTDRSLYSFLALIFLSSICFNLLFYSSIYFLGIFGGTPAIVVLGKDFWVNLIWQIFFNTLAVFLLFYVINFVSQRLRPVFLKRKK